MIWCTFWIKFLRNKPAFASYGLLRRRHDYKHPKPKELALSKNGNRLAFPQQQAPSGS